jgi:hypothetical protein
MLSMLPLLLALQQPHPGQFSSPPTGDTTGYWQQRVSYRITATLDESAERLRADGTLWYVNNSPNALGEIFLHQHLNAFRPHSAWSAADEREGRNRFQDLPEPDQGFERFTRAPMAEGVPLAVSYPGSPDSTVVRLRLPRSLAPGDSIRIDMAWEARPSTTTRRQGRKGRHWDFAHWYPRVAVYDRGGWQHNPLVPAGEFYGEFGSFDVTLVVRDDQVIGATGVPVEGDPGWDRVHRDGALVSQRDAYGTIPPGPAVTVPAGHRAVRWMAKDVHHFAWSAAPDYIHEGTTYVREVNERLSFRTWDTVAVHVLYRPGDEATWGRGIAARRTVDALRWLEQVFGPYGYPQVTNLHRLDPGGTEFPMMMMNGSPSAGLILHEAAHIYVHGMLANNEWRSGWMDEGLSSYVTSWAQNLTAQERAAARRTEPPRRRDPDYRGLAHTLSRDDQEGLPLVDLELAERAQPIGTVSQEFREFAIYNASIYTAAEQMYGALRDVIGDDAFRRFLRDFYRRWAFKHVDELAMRASAERVSRQQLTWFFDQWLRDTGLMDYSIEDQLTVQKEDGSFATRVAILRRGRLAHPMPVGALVDTGWIIVRAEPWARRQVVEILTSTRPREVRIDPQHVTADWDRRNDVWVLPIIGRNSVVLDWPFLDQSDRERNIAALSPVIWASNPGGVTLGARVRGHYLGRVDQRELGVAVATRAPDLIPAADGRVSNSPPASQVQLWMRWSNPTLPLLPRPAMGHAVGLAMLDGIALIDYTKRWDLSPFHFARGPRVSVTAGALGAFPFDRNFLPTAWKEADIAELRTSASVHLPAGRVPARGAAPLDTLRVTGSLYGGYLGPERSVSGDRGYLRAEVDGVRVRYTADTATAMVLRAFAGWNRGTPEQRTLRAGARDAVDTFSQHWYRPRDAILRLDGVHYVPLGGAGIRAAAPDVFIAGALGANAEVAQRLHRLPEHLGQLAVWGSVFADAAYARPMHTTTFQSELLADAGAGVSLRGRLFDRGVRARIDVPFLTTHPGLTRSGGGSFAARYVFALEDWY